MKTIKIETTGDLIQFIFCYVFVFGLGFALGLGYSVGYRLISL